MVVWLYGVCMDSKSDVIEKIKSVINSYTDNLNLSNKRKEEVELLKHELDLITTCNCPEVINIKGSKKPKRKNKRSEFMGSCMRSIVKGGNGKDMKTCSDEYKEMVKKNG